MSSWRAFLEATHALALGLWAGSVAMSGAAAAVAFPTMKAMGVRVPNVPATFATDEYRFAAGAVAARVFLVADIVSFACAVVAVLAFLGLVVGKHLPARGATAVRAVALSIALACLASMLLVISPGINSASRLHLQAVLADDAAGAATHKKAVDDLHRPSQALLGVELLTTVTALWAGVWSIGAPRRARAIPESPYPTPALLQKGRA